MLIPPNCNSTMTTAAGMHTQTANELTRTQTYRGGERADILGIPIDNVTLEQTVSMIRDMALSGNPHHVVTVNPEFVMIARKNEEFRRVLREASLAIPDGIGIVLAAKILRQRLSERVAGVDTVHRLARVARDHGLSLFLLGAAPGVAEKTGTILCEQNPGLKIAGTYAGSPHPREEDQLCSIIERAHPDILLVAYGPPRQDLWIARTSKRLRVPVAMGVGGTFDFIAGVAKRAPVLVRKLGLEWLHRLIREPHRWRRMLTLPAFALVVFQVGVLRVIGQHGGDGW
jgi:N-acetylglucosaminyldiphosphoundecaprenol N-acetyl-beta-D-mannosaminyltransferase